MSLDAKDAVVRFMKTHWQVQGVRGFQCGCGVIDQSAQGVGMHEFQQHFAALLVSEFGLADQR